MHVCVRVCVCVGVYKTVGQRSDWHQLTVSAGHREETAQQVTIRSLDGKPQRVRFGSLFSLRAVLKHIVSDKVLIEQCVRWSQ